MAFLGGLGVMVWARRPAFGARAHASACASRGDASSLRSRVGLAILLGLMKLLARLRRGTGATAIALFTATTMTAVWAVPTEAVAKPKSGKKSTKKSKKSKKVEEEPPDVDSEAEAVDPEAVDPEVVDPAEAPVEAEPAEPTGADYDEQARAAFDGGNYRTAGELWTLALEGTPEGKKTHVDRSVMLINAVNAYKQVYAETNEREALFSGRSTIHAYMRACKSTYDVRCNGYAETDDARALLAEVTELIDKSEDMTLLRAPPEYNTAIGGRPLDVAKRHDPLPAWTLVAAIGGIAVIGGGSYLLYWARTEPRFQTDESTDTAIARFADEDTTTDDGTDGTGTTTTSSSLVPLSDESKGKIYTGLGIGGIAIGVGFIVLGALGIRKHRRINRRENIALSPSFGPSGGGMVLQGRF